MAHTQRCRWCGFSIEQRQAEAKVQRRARAGERAPDVDTGNPFFHLPAAKGPVGGWVPPLVPSYLLAAGVASAFRAGGPGIARKKER
jgi:hypothetical protein